MAIDNHGREVVHLDREKVVSLLLKRNITFTDLARTAGVSTATIHNGFKGTIYRDTAIKIARALGVAAIEIIAGGDGQ